MPITQSRMIAVINAGFDYKQGLDTLLDLIAQQKQLLESGAISPADFLNILLPSAKLQFLLNDPVISTVTLLSEEKHFRLHGKRNRKKAEKVKANRLADREGLPRPVRATTAPPSISRPHGQRRNLLQESGTATGPDFGETLELGTWETPEVIIPEDYVPGTLTDKQKAEIEAFAEQRKAGERFQPLAGYTIAQAICVHVSGEPGETCQDCGGLVPVGKKG